MFNKLTSQQQQHPGSAPKYDASAYNAVPLAHPSKEPSQLSHKVRDILESSEIAGKAIANLLLNSGIAVKNVSKLTSIIDGKTADWGTKLPAELNSGGETHCSVVISEAAILNEPDTQQNWLNLGLALSASGSWERANVVLDHGASLVCDNQYFFWHLAVAKLVCGATDKAVQAFSLAESFGVDNKRILPFLVVATLAQGDVDAARSFCSQHPSEPFAEVWIRRRLELVLRNNLLANPISDPAGVIVLSDLIIKCGLADSLPEFVAVDDDETRSFRLLIGLKGARDAGDKDRAHAFLDRIVSQSSQQPSVWGAVVLGYLELNRPDDAMKSVLDKPNLNKSDVEPILDALKSYPPDRVVTVFEALSQRCPRYLELLRAFGFCAHQAGVHDKSISALTKYKNSRGEDVLALLALGKSTLMIGKSAEAATHLKNVVALDEDNVEAKILLAGIHFQLQEYQEAADLYYQVGAAHRSHCDNMQYIATLRSQREHEAAAILAKSTFEATKPNTDAWRHAFTLFIVEAALSGDTQILEDAKNCALSDAQKGRVGFDGELLRGIYLFNLRELNSAETVFKLLVKKNGGSALANFWLAYTQAQIGHFQASLQIIDGCIGNKGGALSSEFVLLKMHILLQTGKIDDAMRLFEGFAGTEHLLAHAKRLLGRSLFARGLIDEARPFLEEALAGLPRDVELQRNVQLVKLYFGENVSPAKTGSKESSADQNSIDVAGPVVTIGVPNYNESRFLSDALQSVWLQAYPFWDCIVVDDCSKDDSINIGADYERLDPRFRTIQHKKNRGLAASRNTALAASDANFITFVDGDDFVGLHSITSRCHLLTRSTDPMMAGSFCGVRHYSEDVFGELIPGSVKVTMERKDFRNSSYNAPFNAHAPLLKSDVIKSVGGFDEKMKHGAEDWDCWVKIMRAGYHFLPTGSIGAGYRQKRGSMVRAMSSKHVEAAEGIYKKLLGPSNEVQYDQGVARFDQPIWIYEAKTKFAKRCIVFATMAKLADDSDGFNEIVNKIPVDLDSMAMLGIDLVSEVEIGIKRFLAGANQRIGTANRSAYIKSQSISIADEISFLVASRPNVSHTYFDQKFVGESKVIAKPSKTARNQSITAARRPPAYLRLEETAQQYATKQRLEKLKGTHSGERCFIVGNGPSLNKLDLSLLKDEVSIGVNGIFYKTEETGFSPTYYVVEDSSVMKENIRRIIDVKARLKFFPSTYNKLHPLEDNVNFFVMNRGYYEPKSPNYCVPRFSTDFAECAFVGQSVTYINLQLAFYLGFTEIYLIGMDFSYQIPGEFKKQGDIITSTGDDPNHFHPKYFGEGKTWKDPKLERVLANYGMAKLAYESVGRKVINATAGGNLNLFERAEYRDLF